MATLDRMWENCWNSKCK